MLTPVELIAVAVTLLVMSLLIGATVFRWIQAGMRNPDKRRNRPTPLVQDAGQARAKVQELGLPPLFTAVWDNKIPDEFVLWQKPDRYFVHLQEILDRFPRMQSCVPLWEDSGTVYAFDLQTGEYVVCSFYEDPRLEVIADNYQGFAAAELVNSVYAGSDDLEKEAALLEFKYLDRLLKWAAVEDESLDSSEAQRQFVASIPPGR